MMKFTLLYILFLCIHYVKASGPTVKFTDARRKLFPKKTSKRLMKGVVSTSPPLDEKTDSKEMPSCPEGVRATCDGGDVPVKLSVKPGYLAFIHSLTIGKVDQYGSCLNDFTESFTSNFDTIFEPNSTICTQDRRTYSTCKQYDCKATRRVDTYKPYCDGDAKDTSWNAVLSVNFQEAYVEEC